MVSYRLSNIVAWRQLSIRVLITRSFGTADFIGIQNVAKECLKFDQHDRG